MRIYKKGILFFLLILFGPVEIWAHEIDSETDLGTGTFSQGFTYLGDESSVQAAENHQNEKSATSKRSEGWNWTLGYNYLAAALGATASTPSATSSDTDHTSSFTAGLGYSKQWETGVNGTYSNTKEEDLSSIGGALMLGYTFELSGQKKKSIKSKVKKDEEQTDEPFTSTLNFELSAGTTGYTQNFSANVPARKGGRKKLVTRNGSNSIQQGQLELAMTYDPLDWFELKALFTKYRYNKSVSDFLTTLDQPRAIRTGASSFASTLSGFSSSEAELDFNFFLPEDFEIGLGLNQSTSELDGSKTYGFKLSLARNWGEHWKTGIGFERNKSPSDLQNLGILTLSYTF